MKKHVLLLVFGLLAGCTGTESADQMADATTDDAEQATTESAQSATNDNDPAESAGAGTMGGMDMTSELEQAKALGLIIEDHAVGEGAVAEPGKHVFVHYTGWLFDEGKPGNKGDKFDSSLDRGSPFDFPLGGGRVIKGWDIGVAGMNVGGSRTLTIPPELGYGQRGTPGGPIPPNATLVFDVELIDVR